MKACLICNHHYYIIIKARHRRRAFYSCIHFSSSTHFAPPPVASVHRTFLLWCRVTASSFRGVGSPHLPFVVSGHRTRHRGVCQYAPAMSYYCRVRSFFRLMVEMRPDTSIYSHAPPFIIGPTSRSSPNLQRLADGVNRTSLRGAKKPLLRPTRQSRCFYLPNGLIAKSRVIAALRSAPVGHLCARNDVCSSCREGVSGLLLSSMSLIAIFMLRIKCQKCKTDLKLIPISSPRTISL